MKIKTMIIERWYDKWVVDMLPPDGGIVQVIRDANYPGLSGCGVQKERVLGLEWSFDERDIHYLCGLEWCMKTDSIATYILKGPLNGFFDTIKGGSDVPYDEWLTTFERGLQVGLWPTFTTVSEESYKKCKEAVDSIYS